MDTWETASELEDAEWYHRELQRETAEQWLFFLYCKVTDTEIPSRIRDRYMYHKEYHFLNTWVVYCPCAEEMVPELESQEWYREG